MYKIIKEEVEKYEVELIHFKEYVPDILFRSGDVLRDRSRFLKECGLSEEVQEKELYYRRQFKQSENTFVAEMTHAWEWVQEHDEFKSIMEEF